ncbi:Glutamyl-tRNA reductase 1, chloroplastic [Hordeum vulgare]|nr:Glutamyl-tRNA reductase 1, chloroplastic [Hordeum vulgare]
MFAWRLKHDSLALRVNLKKRGIPVENTKCLFCGRADEDGGHLFIKCKNAKAVWRELALEPERRKLQEIPSWSNRNRLREGELPESAEAVARRARANVIQYEQIYCVPKAELSPQRWRPPPDEMIKINVDGSFIPGHEGSGWGVIAQDADGALVAARAGRQERVEDAFGAEVYALAHAISCAAELGLVRVLFETDCTLLQEDMDFARVDASAYAAVIEDLKFQLKLWFSKIKITVCRRETNTATHNLASIGTSEEIVENPRTKANLVRERSTEKEEEPECPTAGHPAHGPDIRRVKTQPAPRRSRPS